MPRPSKARKYGALKAMKMHLVLAEKRRNKAMAVGQPPEDSDADSHSLAQQAAGTASEAGATPAGAQFFEVPPTLELKVEGPVAGQQPPQSTAEADTVAEAHKPRSRLRQRRQPVSYATTRKHDKNLRSREVVGAEERLAGLVRAHPVLYDRHVMRHADRVHSRHAWADVSRRMERPESECISMWRALKTRYSQALTRRKRMLEEGIKLKPSKYENYMSFIKIPTAAVKACADAAPRAPIAPPPQCSCSSPERRPAPAQPRNTLVELFRNLGETVKAFPEDMKNRVKSEVLKVVIDARELVLSNNTVEQLFVVEDIKEEPMVLE